MCDLIGKASALSHQYQHQRCAGTHTRNTAGTRRWLLAKLQKQCRWLASCESRCVVFAVTPSSLTQVTVTPAPATAPAAAVGARQAHTDMQALQAELAGARRAAQAAAGDRDRLEVKYHTYKAAARHQLAANEALQQQLQRAEDEAREARAAALKAAAAAAVVSQRGTAGGGSWADAMSDSEGEGRVAGLQEAGGADGVGPGAAGDT